MSVREWKTSSTMWLVLLIPVVSLPGCGLLGVTSPSGDADGDGVRDALDQCSNTSEGTPVDTTGCPVTGNADTDGDGIPDSEDDCANTAASTTVDATGCAPQQLDGDGDGVSDALDECALTPVTVAVDDRGCPVSAPGTADGDDDGVPDDIDQCANTAVGADVDPNGCAASQLDTDSDDDGVPNDIDQCANTAVGADVDANGCAASQLDTDSDDDGVPNDLDQCANTAVGTDVDANGCPVTTPPPATGPAPVVLGTAGYFVILAKSGIDTVPNSVVTGDIGVSPIDSTAITGFSLILDASTTFSTSTQVTGMVFAADYTPPTPTNMTTAISDMETAYTDAAGRPTPDFTELGAGDISGLTLVPGLYKWGTGVLISTDVTLSGGADDVWIFQIAGGITQASASSVILTGGALPKNIFWQVFGAVAIDTNAHFEGIILCQTEITLSTGASINGRLLSQTAVTLDQSTVTQPAP